MFPKIIPIYPQFDLSYPQTVSLFSLILAFILSASIGFLAWKTGALTTSGGVAAALTGGIIFGIGGFPWALLLIIFFISSSLLSRLFPRHKNRVAEKFSKGSTRDWGQVLANGGLGTLLAIGLLFAPESDLFWIGYAGAIAAVNADTWATELGVLSKTPPRLITSGKVVENGTSGGVTLMGFAASLAGAALIGGAAGLLSTGFLIPFLAAVLGGFAGSAFDSLLGATIQAIYTCPVCEKETEQHPLHTCGSPTEHLRGWRWLNNDWVNVGASLVGSAVAIGIWLIK